jgi:hypothetical protein
MEANAMRQVSGGDSSGRDRDDLPRCDYKENEVRQNLRPGRPTMVAMACGLLLAACGGGGEGENSGGNLQAIAFDYPGGVTLLTGPHTLNATATSGLPVSFASSTPTVCTVAGNQMTVVSAGECRIVASQSGGTSSDGKKWAAADDTSQLFNVLKHPQTVALAAPDYVKLAETNEATVAATSSAGLPVTLSVATPTICSISGSTLKLLAKGSCQVTATQEGDANYGAAKADAFVAVDPLVVADGILGAGQGATRSAMTKQGGAVTANPYSSMIGGWEWCDPVYDEATGEPLERCFRTVSEDERVFTSALHVSKASRDGGIGWHHDGNIIEIFGPGLTGFNQSGDTTGGLQVTTETTFAMTLGVNIGLYNAKKPVLLHLDLGKRNNGCNVTVSTLVWPQSPVTGVGIPLQNFAVTEACGLSDVKTVSVSGNIMTLPNPGTDAVAYESALNNADFKAARDSAWNLIQNYNIVRVRLLLNDNINVDFIEPGTTFYNSDLSVIGAIKIQ